MPLSRDPDARARQLGNLRRAPAAPAGNVRAVRHGGYAAVAADRLDEKVREVYDAVAEDAPLRDADGGLSRHDAVAVRLLAEALCRLEDVKRFLDDYGKRSETTREPRTAVIDLERRLRLEVADYLDAMGMTPRSRAKLGLDLVRAAPDMATIMSEPDPERRASMAAEAGVSHLFADEDGTP